MTHPAARLTGIAKRFGATHALRGASLELSAGRVHGVLGENGAGKSTLLRVLAGELASDAGVVEVAGAPIPPGDPRAAAAAGVAMVHQHFALVPPLTVLENLALARPAGAPGWRRAEDRVRGAAASLMERTGLRVPLDARVEELGVGGRQRVEILKALLRGPRILVLDEPTAVLAPSEVAALFGLLGQLADGGSAVVLVAHKLDEVLAVADDVTVLRAGVTVLARPARGVTARELVHAMVGGNEADPVAVGHGEERVSSSVAGAVAEGAMAGRGVGAPVASLAGVRVRAARSGWAVADATLEVRRGEVVGIAGVEGNGQRELARVLAGVEAPDEGTVRLPPGVGFIPQDRSVEGLVGAFDLTENVALALVNRARYRRGRLLRWGHLRRRTAELMGAYGVRAPGPRTSAGALSGGNQQRVVVARELDMADDLLVAENPTRGLDVAASAFVHAELARLGSDPQGPGVVLLSSDLDEVLALSHRIFVMVRGRLLPVAPGDRTREGVGALMLSGED